MRRGLRAVVLVLASAVLATGMTVVELPAAGPRPADARGVGQTPLDDILFWADQKKACGLSRDQLAAMMLAPSYPETGASGTTAPSPMTLSRWDTQSALYAFGDKATPWQKAFFHPGVGMWQFDSAGGWNMTAANAISTWSSAQQAATTMASRWCANPTRKNAWAPWYGCATSNVCEDIYNYIFDGSKLRNLSIYSNVGRDGGMEARACRFGATQLTCHYVDPARAQGHNGWAYPSAGPTPITAPFYVFSLGGREYRIWLAQDTGYLAAIRADKPVTANARTSLVWGTTNEFCDLTLGRGDCGGGPRVATTPWGPRSATPFGSFDAAWSGNGTINLAGWAIDPDVNDPIRVHVLVDWQDKGKHLADKPRPDIAGAVPGYGDSHGFSVNLGGIGTGPKSVCIWAENVGPYGSEDPLLGCRSVTISPNPFGSFDQASAQPGGVRLTGWTIDADTQSPTQVHVYVDNAFAGLGTAGGTRPDVYSAFPWAGANHGFQIDVGAAPGTRNVCAWAINIGPGAHTFLGCRSVVVPDGNPFGHFDSAARSSGGGVRVAGWAIDPNTVNAVEVHAYVNGTFVGAFSAGTSRSDVGAAFPAFGANHGFDTIVWDPGGPLQVCLFAINVGPGSTNPLLGCRSVA